MESSANLYSRVIRSSGVIAPVVGGPSNLSGSVRGTPVDFSGDLSGAVRRMSWARAVVATTANSAMKASLRRIGRIQRCERYARTLLGTTTGRLNDRVAGIWRYGD